jgi:phage-related baseplate assembly protein
MSGRFTAVDLSKLAPPALVETVDFEVVFAEMLADVQSRFPAFSALVESDPAYKLMEVFAYRETLLRARVNDAARAVMLAYAGGPDLDHLAALFGVERLVIVEADLEAVPPVAAVLETDTALRARVQLALEGFSTAGSRAGYVFHALSASGLVRDVSVTSPGPGEVLIAVLSWEGDGTASPEIVDLVAAATSSERVRPLCSLVTVQSVALVEFEVSATLTIGSGPDSAVIVAAAQVALDAYLASARIVGGAIRRSALFAALHVAGVSQVVISSPSADVEPTDVEAAFCTSIAIDVA